MSAPGDAGNLVEAGRAQLLPARWSGDDGLRFHVECEFARDAIRHKVGVFRCFFPGIGRLLNGLQATQPFHVHVAFEAGQQQPQRIALLRTQPLAVLAVHQHRIIKTFVDRNTARQRRGIGAFGHQPFGFKAQPRFLQNELQADPGPLRATQQADKVGGGLAVRLGIDGVAGTFDKVDSGFRWKAADVFHREDQRPVHQSMQHQPMLLRIDRGNAAMMALVEQSVRRDDAIEILQRRPSRRGNVLRQFLRDVLDNVLLER